MSGMEEKQRLDEEFRQVSDYAQQYNLVPIVREVLADTETPIRLFQHFYESPCAFLLESVEGGSKWARYSFIGTDPFLTIRCKRGLVEVEESGSQRTVEGKPLHALKTLLAQYRSPQLPDLPRFSGGAVGFFGYDLLQYYERLPAHKIDDLQMNDLQFMFCDQVIVFDHLKQRIKVIANVHVPTNGEALIHAYEQTCAKIEMLLQSLAHPLSEPLAPIVAHEDFSATLDLTSNLSK